MDLFSPRLIVSYRFKEIKRIYLHLQLKVRTLLSFKKNTVISGQTAGSQNILSLWFRFCNQSSNQNNSHFRS